MRRWPIMVISAGLVVSLGTAIVAFRQAAQSRASLEAAKAESGRWQARAETAERQVAELRGEQPEQRSEADAAKPREAHSKEDVAARLELVRLLAEKDEKLAALAKDYEQLSARARSLDDKAGTLLSENQRLAASEKDAREELDTAKRLAEALQTELRGNSTRSGLLEKTNQQLRDREQEARLRSERLAKLGDQLDDLNRRRDALVSGIQRRYRDVTDQYRALNLQISNPRDGVSPSSTDLSRVQNAIYQAEDDLRQLDNLNQRAARLQKDIAAARK